MINVIPSWIPSRILDPKWVSKRQARIAINPRVRGSWTAISSRGTQTVHPPMRATVHRYTRRIWECIGSTYRSPQPCWPLTESEQAPRTPLVGWFFKPLRGRQCSRGYYLPVILRERDRSPLFIGRRKSETQGRPFAIWQCAPVPSILVAPREVREEGQCWRRETARAVCAIVVPHYPEYRTSSVIPVCFLLLLEVLYRRDGRLCVSSVKLFERGCLAWLTQKIKLNPWMHKETSLRDRSIEFSFLNEIFITLLL